MDNQEKNAEIMAVYANSKEYFVNENGLYGYDKKGETVKISNFIARPRAELIKNDGRDGNTPDRYFLIDGVSADGELLPEIVIAAKDLAAMQWVLPNWGIRASFAPTGNPKERFRDAIQSCACDIEKKLIYTHLGWQMTPAGWIYLSASGAIGGGNVEVELEPELQKFALPAVLDQKKACAASLKLLDVLPHSTSIPLLALTYLAPLTSLFKAAGCEPTFLVWLFGPTGTRKTSVAKVFLSHFGSLANTEPPASFKDTANSIEKLAFCAKDSLLLVDDFHPASSHVEEQEMRASAQKLLRGYGDRVGRGRLNSSLNLQKKNVPRGMALVTGEDAPSGESALARCLALELDAGQVDLQLLTLYQSEENLLAEAMASFITWMQPQVDSMISTLKSKFVAERFAFQNADVHGRAVDAAAWLSISFGIFLEFLFDINLIDEFQKKKLEEESKEVLLATVANQAKFARNAKPEDVFIAAVVELLASQKISVQPVNSTATTFSGDHVGWCDDKYYYFLPDTIVNRVAGFLSARGERFAVSSKMLYKKLGMAGYVFSEETAQGPRFTVKKYIAGLEKMAGTKRPRLLHVYRDVIDDELVDTNETIGDNLL